MVADIENSAYGESLRVDTGCIVAMEEQIDYDIQMVPGIKTALFGGEGLFFAQLRGPGRVLLQTMPFSRLAETRLAPLNRARERSAPSRCACIRIAPMRFARCRWARVKSAPLRRA